MSGSHAKALDDLVEFAAGGTVSKTVLETPAVRVTLFCMAAGQALTEHSAGHPVTVHFIRGEGEFTLDGRAHAIAPGAWFYLEAGAPHALRVERDTVFLLTLFRR